MRPTLRTAVCSAFATLLLLRCAIAQDAAPESFPRRAETMAASVAIARDEFGVPHISGPTDEAAVFGFMYARAEDEFPTIEQCLIVSLGRAAEVYGEAGLGWDRLVHALEIPRRAQAEYDRANPKLRALCQAGADALDLYLRDNPGAEPKLLHHFEPWWFFAAELGFNVYMGQAAVQAVTGIDDSALPGVSSPIDGSNAWALAPSRTVGEGGGPGHAMLFINPHIPLTAPYEAHLRSDEGWDFTGMAAYGRGLMPIIGHNARLGWSLTVNYPDIADTYAVDFDDPKAPLTYRYGAGRRTATAWTDTIGVLGADGKVEPRRVRFVKTHQGPIVGKAGGRYIALRVSRVGDDPDDGGLLGQWYAMSKAQNLDEFKAAIGRLGLCFHNVIYADADGNIFYVYNGAIPRRSDKFDWSSPVDGSDPRTEWRGYYALSELPQVLNPSCGFIQSCNSTPFETSADGNPDPGAFPKPLVGPDEHNYRVVMSHAILGRPERFSFEDLTAAAFDTYVYSADDLLPQLERSWRALEAKDGPAFEQLREPMEALLAWDKRAAADSVPTTLYMLWFELSLPRIATHSLKDEDCAPTLVSLLGMLDKSFQTWRVPWGDVNRHQRPGPDPAKPWSDDRESLPVAGGHGAAGLVFTFIARAQGTKLRYGFHGHGYASVVEFGDPVRAASIVPYGASTDPGSAHYLDQAPIYASGHFKQAWFTAEDVRAHAVRTYHPGE
ncbi:MAG: penicillin acylase family protein [Phycisphaerales bacterium]|nr:penicillin acylase family protein [Phycisphaerales bacterium]